MRDIGMEPCCTQYYLELKKCETSLCLAKVLFFYTIRPFCLFNYNSKGALLPVLEWCSVGLFPFASQTPGDEKVVPTLKHRVKGLGHKIEFKNFNKNGY
jgi:hypothetical protein